MRSIFIVLLFWTASLHAQPYLDLGQVSYHNSPGGDPHSFQHLRAQVNLPKVFRDSSVLVINPIWEERWYQVNEADPQTHLRSFITWFTLTKRWSKKWETLFAVIPRWAGEPSIQFSDGFQLGFATAMVYRPRPGLAYKLGVYYNKEFFGNFIVPVWGIDWKINKKQRLFGMLPGYFTYEHRISPKFSWGGNFRTFTNSYRVAPAIPGGQNGFVRFDDNQIGAYLDYYLTKHVVLNLEGGYSALRKIRSGQNSKEDMQYLSKHDGAYVRLVLQYRLRFDKNPF